jgi:hypothetical protein
MEAGHTYLTDELVLLMPACHMIRPVPVSLGIKRGSWPVLEPQYPRLGAQPIHRQPDGTEVRYLTPSEDRLPGGDSYPIRAIIFPRYAADGPTDLRELGAAEALYRLAEAGYAVPGHLEPSVVAELVSWISLMHCYELGVRDLDTAVTQVGTMLS